MKKLMNLLRRIPKRSVVMAAAALAVVTPAIVMAWGPDRKLFTMENPATFVTFNSITNNPEVGDERNFLVIKDAANTNAGGWQDTMNAEAGKEYLVRVYVHNDAASNLNLKATNTRVKVNVPNTTGKSVDLGGFVTADNAEPKEVWDTAKFTSNSDFNVTYVAGSAKLYNNHFGQTGATLSDSIVTNTGALVGYDKLDGIVPGCIEYAGYVTFKVKVQAPTETKYDFVKDVRKSGTTDKYAEKVSVKPGDKVDFRLTFKNTGTAKLNNVVLKDQLPAGMTYVADSAKLYNSNYPNGYSLGNQLFSAAGANIGHYATNINAFVVFTAQVAGNDQLPKCGLNNLKNVAKVETDGGNKEDDASVDVDKKCEEPKVPVYKCTGLNVETISRTQFKFTGSHQVENAEFVKYIYVVRDEQGKEIARNETGTYTQDKVGKYTVEAIVVVKVDGQEKQATAPECKKPFEVKEQPKENVYACESLTKIQKNRDTFEFTVTPKAEGNVKAKEYNFNFGDGQTQIVGADQKTVTHVYKEARDFTASVAITFEVDGKTVPNVTSDKCKVDVTVKPVECKPGIPENDERCKDIPEQPKTPETPKELPSTGPEAILGGLFGSSALGLGVHSWLNSRRALKNAINKK